MKRRVRWLLGAALAFASFGAFAGPVNINTADATTLAAELTGVGPALAHGKFDTPDALTRVKGIGQKIVEQNRANILVTDPAPKH
jgi:competence protein ComEA